MANTLLTPEMITDEALMILHQKSNFIANCNRQYDKRFAQSGAKIGTNLDVRLPAKYLPRRGAQLQAQNTVDRKVTLPCATQDGIDMNISSVDLTMKIQDFSERYIKPAISQLAANLDNYMMTLAYKQVGNYQGLTTCNFDAVSESQMILAEQLAPESDRAFCITPRSQNEFIRDTKGLFQSSERIKEQYERGALGTVAGFDFYSNTLIPTHTCGTRGTNVGASGNSSVTTTQGNAGTGNAWVETSDIYTDGWTTASFAAGDIVTFDGIYDVHPETKQSTGILKRFAITTAVAATGDITMNLRPAVIYGGAYQNVSGGIPNNTTTNIVGTSGQILRQDIAFHKDAFIFVSADLEDVSQYGAWGARRKFENISMRIAKQWDINNDNVPCRVDILWGGVVAYPELAVRRLKVQS